ncbi:MAG: rhomboid family intramembrane serine protease [Acidobacteriota bacterium]|nr:rhomboid family intramembrane serine protease [Acidobacteriota bacterium]
MKRFTPITTGLLVTIAAVFAYEVMTNAFNNETALRQLGAIVPGLLERGEYWRLVSAMFLHGGWLHWFLNSWALYQLGTLYETMFGSTRFAMVYFISGIVASTASSIHMKEGLGVGASGAIFGILGAFIFSIRRSPFYRNQPWTKGLISQLVFWIVINIAIGASFKFIDNTAHIAGLITGLVLGLIPHRVPPPPPGEVVIDLPSAPPQNQP